MGGGISPNGRFLYLSGMWDSLIQFDLVDSSKVVLFKRGDPYSKLFFYSMKMGLDGRMYLMTPKGEYGTHDSRGYYLSVIAYPDRKGLACGFQEKAVYTGNNNGLGFNFPNIPDYRMPPLSLKAITENYPVDTLYACAGDTLALQTKFPTGISYHWSSAPTLSNDTIANPLVFISRKAAGNMYILKARLLGVLGSCWPDSAEIQVVIKVRPSSDTTHCTSLVERPLQISPLRINLYPNPAADEFVIDYNLTQEKNISLSVYNILGQMVHADEVPPHTVVSTQNWPAGVYICKFELNNQITTQKLVISR